MNKLNFFMGFVALVGFVAISAHPLDDEFKILIALDGYLFGTRNPTSLSLRITQDTTINDIKTMIGRNPVGKEYLRGEDASKLKCYHWAKHVTEEDKSFKDLGYDAGTHLKFKL